MNSQGLHMETLIWGLPIRFPSSYSWLITPHRRKSICWLCSSDFVDCSLESCRSAQTGEEYDKEIAYVYMLLGWI
jgi:hypothetical protein